jgi:putative NADH-flavin reductase
LIIVAQNKLKICYYLEHYSINKFKGKNMNIALIGGTHGVGLEFVKQALENGHTVRVLARTPSKLTIQTPNLIAIQGDVLDLGSVDKVVAGSDAVVSCLGTKPAKVVTVFSEGTKNILAAMKNNKVKRFICITGIGAGDSRGHGGFLYDTVVLQSILKGIYEDKDRQEELIKKSDDIEWEIVRPSFLTNGPLTGKYRVITDLDDVTASSISRADVANFMLNECIIPGYLYKTPLLMY